MPAPYVLELRGRELHNQNGYRLRRGFLIRYQPNEDLAEAYLRTQIPSRLFLSSGAVCDLDTVKIEEKTKGNWYEADVTYVEAPAGDPGPGTNNDILNLAFQIQTQSKHITQSLETMGRYIPDGGTVDTDPCAIGMTAEGQIAGTDILEPILSFSYGTNFHPSMITWSYVKQLGSLVGKPNDVPWQSFERGEIMCVGVQGSFRQQVGDWALDFTFLTSPNVTNLELAGGITVTEKKGFDYLWVRYDQTQGSSNKILIQAPKQAWVERVYQYADLRGLGIG